MGATKRGDEIVADFTHAVSTQPGFKITRSPISRNVFDLIGPAKCLLYVKARSEGPWRWGVTANVLTRLQAQDKPWAVVLLAGSHDAGFLLSRHDVEFYTRSVWPLGKDGDYKPAKGTYLKRNIPFDTMEAFCFQLNSVCLMQIP